MHFLPLNTRVRALCKRRRLELCLVQLRRRRNYVAFKPFIGPSVAAEAADEPWAHKEGIDPRRAQGASRTLTARMCHEESALWVQRTWQKLNDKETRREPDHTAHTPVWKLMWVERERESEGACVFTRTGSCSCKSARHRPVTTKIDLHSRGALG